MAGSAGPRAPAALYSALSVALVLLIAGLAFSARQPPPPQIAELTPQAQHQITKAPTEQSSSLGSANGGAGAAEGGAGTTVAAPTTSTAAQRPPLAPIDVAAVHHCFGSPPRQIKDTQSPPCVAYWVGNNGGATSRGVTADQVTVLVNPAGLQDQNASRVVTDLQAFFNRYFELYGRSLKLVPFSPSGGDCAAARASADGLVQSYRPFAVTDPDNATGGCFGPEVAHDHAVEAGFAPWFSTSTLAAYAPYLWEYPMAYDGELASTASFVCDQLAGGRARYSPDPVIAAKRRRFGLIFEYEETSYPFDLSPLEDEMRSCGAGLAAVDTWEDTSQNSEQSDQSEAAFVNQAVLDMKSHGVTTVLCYCLTLTSSSAGVGGAADAQQYYPEWILGQGTQFSAQFDTVVKTFWPQADQRQGMLGITFEPAQVPYPSATLNWALAAADPGFQVDYSSLELDSYQQFYWEMLLIASGIQMAGPDLTPATFQRGLQDARFPNPYSPQMEGAVGFSGAGHAMTIDAAAMWWSNTAPSPYPDEGVGAWCYADGGRRFTAAAWSQPMTFYAAACDSAPPGS